MPIDTVVSLVGLIQKHQLLEPAQLDELTGVLVPHFPDPRALAKELLQRGWLTAFQLNQLFRDRGGELKQGNFLLLERLGAGGMGQVFKAKHLKFDCLVALKLIHRERTPSEEFLRRFRREMTAAVRLDHPNIVRTVDVGEKNGVLYFAMEYLQGIDLQKLVKQRGALSAAEACLYARQAALGLQHAHEHGLVHRDIKPGNLFLTARERTIKILDFGLTRLDELDATRSATTLTKSGHIVGTPDYIAPEQARNSHGADIRADLYSLGCTLYYLLAGHVPFPKGSMTDKLIQHQVEPPKSLLEVRPEVPPSVAAIVHKLLAKCPEDRYQTPAETAEALASGAGDVTLADLFLPVPIAPPLDSSFLSSELDTTVASSYRSGTPRTRGGDRNGLLLLGIAAALGVLLCGGLLALARLLLRH
jgi:eukaryotic-like serine/threonine-protein kinase